jgi:hypothetical protein
MAHQAATQYTFSVIAAVRPPDRRIAPRAGARNVPSLGSVNWRAEWGSGRATVHHNLGASNVGSIVRRQIQNGFSYLVGFAKATERNSPHDPLF